MTTGVDLTSLGLDDEERGALAAAARSVPAMLSQVCGVRAYPVVVQKIRRVASDPKATVAALAAVVETDLAFSTRMLRLVNSAGVGLSSRCATIKHAVALLGTRKVADIAAAAATLDLVQAESSEAREILATRSAQPRSPGCSLRTPGWAPTMRSRRACSTTSAS